jgi:hypothetical protein
MMRLPLEGPLPQISQTLDMVLLLRKCAPV